MNEEPEVKGKVNPIDSHVGKRLKIRRIMLGLSQNDLGEAVNVSIQQIQKYEKATNRISSGRLYAFAKLLKVPITYFFDNISASSSTDVKYDLAAEEQEQFSIEDTFSEKELISLVKSFSDIKDPHIRKKILDLVKTISAKPDEKLL